MSNLDQTKLWGLLSFGISLFFIVLLIIMWVQGNKYMSVEEQQLTGKLIEEKCQISPSQCDDVNVWLDKNWFSLPTIAPRDETTIVPTGIFVLSFRFISANEVSVTGHIWQKFSEQALINIGQYEQAVVKDVNNEHEQKNFFIEQGIKRVKEGFFVFPEQIGSDEFHLDEVTQIKAPDGSVQHLHVWHFDINLRQNFQYDKYPFDHKTVWIKIWPKAFGKDVVLTPDLMSYQDTSAAAIYGYDIDIVLGSWDIENTFFDYNCTAYNTTFGALPYQQFMEEKGQALYEYLKDRPDLCWQITDADDNLRISPTLRYNIIIKRQFESAFITHFIPLFVVAALLFSLIMMMSKDPEKSNAFGLNTAAVIGSCSGLFFTVMLAHINLKQEFSGVGIVYMEYFYFMMYFIILAIAVNSYLFYTDWKSRFNYILYRDNLLFKLAYWPFILGFMVIVTWLTLVE